MERIVIVGGGVIGMLTARELARAGVRVTVIERQTPARESSWAGGGIISPLYPWRYLDSISELADYSQQAYPALAEQLHRDTGIDPELEPSGLMVIAPDEERMAVAWARRRDKPLELIDAASAASLEPAFAAKPASAIWLPDVHQVRNPRLTAALYRDILRRGVERVVQTPVEDLDVSGGRIRGVRTAGGLIAADAVVICAGAWTRQLLEHLSNAPYVRPVRGQMLLFRGTPGAIRRMVLEESRYVIPRRDGRVLFGSTLEEVGFDKSTTANARTELESLAVQRFPVLRSFAIEQHWAGLRPGSPAGVPYIAPHTDIENLFVNAGHYRNGIVLGPASARLLSDLVLNRPAIVPPAPYALLAPRG